MEPRNAFACQALQRDVSRATKNKIDSVFFELLVKYRCVTLSPRPHYNLAGHRARIRVPTSMPAQRRAAVTIREAGQLPHHSAALLNRGLQSPARHGRSYRTLLAHPPRLDHRQSRRSTIIEGWFGEKVSVRTANVHACMGCVPILRGDVKSSKKQPRHDGETKRSGNTTLEPSPEHLSQSSGTVVRTLVGRLSYVGGRAHRTATHFQ